MIEHNEAGNHDVKVRDLYRLDGNPGLLLDDTAGQRKGTVVGDVKQKYITRRIQALLTSDTGIIRTMV